MNFKKLSSVALIIFISILSTPVFSKEIVVAQKNKTFVMDGKKVDKYEVHRGDTILFENQDPWFHNVFSLSDLKTFDLGSYPKGDSRPVTFDKSGVVEVECAIHPSMFMKVIIQ